MLLRIHFIILIWELINGTTSLNDLLPVQIWTNDSKLKLRKDSLVFSYHPISNNLIQWFVWRRSTISSNMTLTNSTDVSEYVQQESNPVKPEFFQHNLNQTSELGSDYSRIRFSPDTYATMSPSSPIPEVNRTYIYHYIFFYIISVRFHSSKPIV